MKRKIVITKKRTKALAQAISMDDLLYERHRRMLDEIHREINKWERKKQVKQVVYIKNGMKYLLQITHEVKTPEGIFIEVR